MPPSDESPYERLPTEQPNRKLRCLDTLGAVELVDLIHGQDVEALRAVGQARREVADVVAAAEEALAAGGRLVYLGAGTSGRLATLDAAECPPTFGVSASRVVALMAGGPRALRRAVEGAEDSRGDGRKEVRRLTVAPPDMVCGVSASGTTAFVLGGLAEARRRGCRTALITCAPAALVRPHADLVVALEIGAETVAGSTRMKSGLAQKAVLHTISTAVMIRLGKVYDNLMVDVRPTSRKLRHRAARIVAALTGLERGPATRLLTRAGGSPKVAAVMFHRGVSRRQARALLGRSGGKLRPVIGEVIHGP
jgi:N-acetylmuramic acid 6-phosphate etherase